MAVRRWLQGGVWLVVVAGMGLAGCTRRNDAKYCNDGTCTTPDYPFCDVSGFVSGEPGTCIAVTCTPGDFGECRGDAELRCNTTGNNYNIVQCERGCDTASDGCRLCDPGETACTNNLLEVCGTNGQIVSTQQCGLGCSNDGSRCNLIDPSNGLASYIDQGAQQIDVTIPDGATINTDSGTVSSTQGTIAVATATVPQPGGPTLRVLIAKSFTIESSRVTGSLPLALVASGDITLRGVLDASADEAVAGPGAVACGSGDGGAPGAGFFGNVPAGNSGGYPNCLWNINGSGGGGFGMAGGAGGLRTTSSARGVAGAANGQDSLVPLRGGCSGYAAITSYQGQGGGAIQLVAGAQVHLVDAGPTKGKVHVGGGGGHAGDLGKASCSDVTPAYSPGGGGSGGGILIEAPSVVLDDGTALLAVGGGGGGYGACAPAPNGLSAPATAATPTGGACPAGTTPAASGGDAGMNGGDTITAFGSAGSGGGGLGRIRVNTANGEYTAGNSTIVRGVTTTGFAGRR